MPFTIASPAVVPVGPEAIAVSGSTSSESMSPRALHARLLANAAQRRQRGQQRREESRPEDAEYWISAAFAAIGKAHQTRLAALPLP